MRLTVARSAIFADHFGVRDDLVDYMDLGIQHFSYALMPHAGTWRQSDIVRRSRELLQPAIAVLETWHKGVLPLHGSFFAISQANVIAEALKIAEDGGDLILRCDETIGLQTEATVDLRFDGVRWNEVFSPYEIKTFRISRDGGVRETNLLEM